MIGSGVGAGFLSFGSKWGFWAAPASLVASVGIQVFADSVIAQASRRHIADVESLAATGDHRIIGPLIEALSYSTGLVLDAVMSSLTDVLARTYVDTRIVLTPGQLVVLRKELSPIAYLDSLPEARIRLLEQLLRTLPCLGDEKALAAAERLRAQRASSERHRWICDTAAEAIPLLQERLEREQRTAALLRPAESPGEETALLRVPSGTPASEAASLLRPVDN